MIAVAQAVDTVVAVVMMTTKMMIAVVQGTGSTAVVMTTMKMMIAVVRAVDSVRSRRDDDDEDDDRGRSGGRGRGRSRYDDGDEDDDRGSSGTEVVVAAVVMTTMKMMIAVAQVLRSWSQPL